MVPLTNIQVFRDKAPSIGRKLPCICQSWSLKSLSIMYTFRTKHPIHKWTHNASLLKKKNNENLLLLPPPPLLLLLIIIIIIICTLNNCTSKKRGGGALETAWGQMVCAHSGTDQTGYDSNSISIHKVSIGASPNPSHLAFPSSWLV